MKTHTIDVSVDYRNEYFVILLSGRRQSQKGIKNINKNTK